MIVIMPWLSIIFFRKTDDDVKEIVKQVSKLLKAEMFSMLALILWDRDLVLTTESVFEIDTNLNTEARGSSQLLGMGIGGSLTGKHADVVITDDIVTIRDRVSRAKRDETRVMYRELENIKNPGGRFINTGTPWHKDDAFELMPNITKYDCYSTGMMTRQEVEEIKSKLTPSLFAANYELKHIADGAELFGNPGFADDDKLLYNGVGHIDASYGGDDGTAFTIFKIHEDKIIGFGRKWNKHVDQCLNEIYLLHEHYKVGTIWMERNADKGYVVKDIRKAGVPARDYFESQNKFIKISTHLRGAWKDIQWVEQTDPDYINEILDYTENSIIDDCPDSAASLVRILKRGQATRVKSYSGRGARA